MRRTWLVLFGLAITGGLLYWSLARRPAAVQVAQVTRGPFEQTVDEDGKAQVRERFLVTAPLAGRIARIAWKAGDAVQAGQVLAMLTPLAPALIDARSRQQLKERVGAAEAQYARALADSAQAKVVLSKREGDLARAQRLAQEGFLSSVQLEQARLELQLAGRVLDAARQATHASEHELATMRAALQQSRQGASGEMWSVRAPVAGTVLKVFQESEGSIAQGASLMELGNPMDLEIVADVLSTDAVEITPGSTVWIERWGGLQVLRGRVRRVEPSAFSKVSVLGVEEQRVNVVIDLISPLGDAGRLSDGFRVEVRIVVYHAEQVLRLPLGALFRQGRDWAVYVVEGGKVRVRKVQVGRRSQHEAVLLGGLAEGSLVVLYPADTLTDGMRVRAISP